MGLDTCRENKAELTDYPQNFPSVVSMKNIMKIKSVTKIKKNIDKETETVVPESAIVLFSHSNLFFRT